MPEKNPGVLKPPCYLSVEKLRKNEIPIKMLISRLPFIANSECINEVNLPKENLVLGL